MVYYLSSALTDNKESSIQYECGPDEGYSNSEHNLSEPEEQRSLLSCRVILWQDAEQVVPFGNWLKRK